MDPWDIIGWLILLAVAAGSFGIAMSKLLVLLGWRISRRAEPKGGDEWRSTVFDDWRRVVMVTDDEVVYREHGWTSQPRTQKSCTRADWTTWVDDRRAYVVRPAVTPAAGE